MVMIDHQACLSVIFPLALVEATSKTNHIPKNVSNFPRATLSRRMSDDMIS